MNLFKKKFKRCYCYQYNRQFRQQHIRHSFLQHLSVLLLGDYIDANGKSCLKTKIKMHFSSKKVRLENYIQKNFPKIYYLLNWKINKRNIWVEIYSWLMKNKVVLQKTKKGLIVYLKSESEIMEKRLKYYDSFL